MQILPHTFLATCLACGSRSLLSYAFLDEEKNIHTRCSYFANAALRSHPLPKHDAPAIAPTLVLLMIIEESLCPFAGWERIA